MRLQALLVKHEGVRHTLYKDSLGIPTIGVGHNLNKPLSNEAVEQILKDDIADAKRDAESFPWFNRLDDVRQAVVIDMLFNMGLSRFKGFKRMIGHIAAGTYSAAALEMLDSLWAKQVGKRAEELAEMMRSGQWSDA